MSGLYTSWLPKQIPYTGVELAPHWISGQTGIFSSGIVAFRGPCLVKTEELVDLEDSREGETIQAAEMLHFLGEWFDGGLELAIARQRLLIAGFAELLSRQIASEHGRKIRRLGNDLFVGDRKLSVSIVTASPVSTLFHFGVNIDPSGAPVNAVGLVELGADPEELAKAVLALWKEEWQGMLKARCKVVPR